MLMLVVNEAMDQFGIAGACFDEGGWSGVKGEDLLC